jgi:RecB family exonuclease
VTRDALARAAPWPAVRTIWSARLARSAPWFLEGERERRARARPLAREVRGARPLAGTPQPFTVTAKADRIDRTPAGAYAIYDYKSGGIPSKREAAAFHLQLPLEGAIAMAGGFEGLPPGPAVHLELVGLGAQASLVIPTDPDTVWTRLRTLVAAYQADPFPGFTARLRPQRLIYASDYDHLSRHGEWADADPPAPEDVG